MRAPTPIELTCADPDAPCKLPNQFLADPPLKAGDLEDVRGRRARQVARDDVERRDLSAPTFATTCSSSSSNGGANAGYFQNVGRRGARARARRHALVGAR